MTGRQRVAMAMRHGQPDRVPVMCQLALGHYFLNGRHSPADIWFDGACLADTLVGFQARYGFDGILVNLPGRPPDWRECIADRRAVDPGEIIRWKNGLETRIPPDDNPHTLATSGAALPRANCDTVDPDDPATYRVPGYVWNTWHAPTLWDIPDRADLSDPGAYPEWFTSTVAAVRSARPNASVHAEVFSPFTHLIELFGYEQALMALVDVPETCLRLLDVFTGIVCAQVRCHAQVGPDAILISSAFAGAGFIGREMYQRFVLPFERRVAEAIRGANLPSYTHTCGAIGDRLDLMAETCVDGIDTLDPPPLGTVDLAKAKAEFGDRFFFKGNLDAVNEMLNADDATFERAVRQRLEIGMPGGGYILSSACSVAPHVAPERLIRMVELAERHGRYD
ncbi:MAG TPA: uroporphyrinogen decarboxylase family protein [Verrucomicrobiae bacterium]|nr:uroporphyrinogen decarboxylase family protein [Verrucomicrobiae bacterium]